MFEINEENLKYAYQKFKNYVFYYNFSSYLKQKIVTFEENYNDNTFKNIANTFNSFSNVNDIRLSEIVSYLVLPKKDRIKNDEGNLKIEDYNMFIDMPLEYYLIDVLFSLDLIEHIDRKIFRYSFGITVDDRIFDLLDNDENILYNKLLFSSYNNKYKMWKQEIYINALNNKDKNLLLIKADLSKCYYNLNFNIESFISKNSSYDPKNDFIGIIESRIYSYYTGIMNNRIDGNPDHIEKTHFVNLPIGLLSSYIILNIQLSKLDLELSKKSLGYSRYVDDMLILVEGKKEGNNIEILERHLSNLLIGKENIEFSKDLVECEKLIINESKIDVIDYVIDDDIELFFDEIQDKTCPSIYLDDNYIENRNYFDVSSSNNLEYLRKFIFELKYIEDNRDIKRAIDFINNMNDEDILNIFSYWKDIIEFLNSHSSSAAFLCKAKQAINNINKIDKVKKNEEKNVVEKFKQSLEKELNFAINYAIGKYKKQYFYNINQNDIFEYIDECIQNKNTSIFYPNIISPDIISIYCCLKDGGSINTERINNLYYFLNNICLPNNISIEGKKLIRINNITNKNSKNRNKINVAIASLKMFSSTDIEESDFSGGFNGSYGIGTIRDTIKIAKKEGAEIIIFPEFAIPSNNIIDVIRFSKEYGISVISGLNHIISDNKIANNCVFIRDKDVKISLLKYKNYYPIDEKFFLAKKGYKLEDLKNSQYFIINTGKYKYSIATCYEATSIKDRALLTDEIEILYMPVYNIDTSYFSSIIDSFSKDASCYVVQSNNSDYGDSRITGPYHSYSKDIVKLKGGKNCFVVVGEIDLEDLSLKRRKEKEIDILIKNTIEKKIKKEDAKKEIEKFKKIKTKPLMAGNNRRRKRIKNGIR